VLERIEDALPRLEEVFLMVPHDRPEIVPWLYREEEVLSSDPGEQGTAVHARVSQRGLARVEEFRSPASDARATRAR